MKGKYIMPNNIKPIVQEALTYVPRKQAGVTKKIFKPEIDLFIKNHENLLKNNKKRVSIIDWFKHLIALIKINKFQGDNVKFFENILKKVVK